MEKSKYIIEKASELYFQYGIKSLTIDELAKELGVSKKTIYRCFKDKEEMVEKAVNYYFDKKRVGHENLGDKKSNAVDKVLHLRSFITMVFQTYNSKVFFDLKRLYPRIYDKLNREKHNRITEMVELNLTEGQKQGLYRKDLSIDIVAKLLAGEFLLTINPIYNIFSVNETLTDTLFDEMWDYHMHALCTPKGLKHFKQLQRSK
ncbi:TetR/AcrR family transcriptional regulator [Prolixibacteraceae bacterium JC049]|nr:TetR/AcrR family transcriptional regulator [Prolixibacteraceae bacterium JC049]